MVTIDRGGKIYWKDNEVTITELEGGLGQWAQQEGTKQLFIKADSAGHFGPVYRVWTAAAANGLLVSILGEPKPPTP
jgi:biopolymer transport protein ExbD